MKIFYDVDTQNDFMRNDKWFKGALPVLDAKTIESNLRALTDYARENFVPVVGSVDNHFGTEEYKHREGELQRWGGPFPDHCMNGTFGQMKIGGTILERADLRTWGSYDKGFYLEHHLYHGYPKKPIPKPIYLAFADEYSERWIEEHWEKLRSGVLEWDIDFALKLVKNTQEKKIKPQGIYFKKQSHDVFTNPSFPIFLEKADIKQAVVYGVATDYCVKAAVLGMQQRDIQCYVIEDAIKGVAAETTKAALEEMTKVGAKLVTTKDILEGRLK